MRSGHRARCRACPSLRSSLPAPSAEPTPTGMSDPDSRSLPVGEEHRQAIGRHDAHTTPRSRVTAASAIGAQRARVCRVSVATVIHASDGATGRAGRNLTRRRRFSATRRRRRRRCGPRSAMRAPEAYAAVSRRRERADIAGHEPVGNDPVEPAAPSRREASSMRKGTITRCRAATRAARRSPAAAAIPTSSARR
jgi:hypothetical protein